MRSDRAHHLAPRAGRALARGLFALLVLASSAGCGGSELRPFPLKEPMWQDPDQTPFTPPPEEYYSPFVWDFLDQSLARPTTRLLSVDYGAESVNVNAWDEVPDSSWFVNRMSRAPMSPEEVAEGPCEGPPPETEGPWTIVGGKPDGENPGFQAKMADGRRYLVKFDGNVQEFRATSGDAVVSRIYHAAGYWAPCNNVVYFDRGILRIAEDADKELPTGRKVPFDAKDLEEVLSKATRMPDGRYRAMASLFLPGKPLGPWTYQGVRKDDPNDVVPHENRRELRGAYLFAAWVNHFDSREQNTLSMFIEEPLPEDAPEDAAVAGHVRHNFVDFGDSFGSLWAWDRLSRRHGHSYIFDPLDILTDVVTLGFAVRPWDQAEFGPSGEIWGYFDVETFDPEDWKNEYPNPAFSRISERDGAWAARILAEFTDAHVEALVAQARLPEGVLPDELKRILIGRRDKLLRRWLSVVSPLARPTLGPSPEGAPMLCLRDLAVFGRVVDPTQRVYQAHAWAGRGLAPQGRLPVARRLGEEVCLLLPQVAGASEQRPAYHVIDVFAGQSGKARGNPLRVHAYQTDATTYHVVGLERPEDDAPPSR